MSVRNHTKSVLYTVSGLAIEVSFLKKVTSPANYFHTRKKPSMRHSTNEISHAKGGFHQNCFQLNATPSRAVPRCPGSAASLWSAAKFQRKNDRQRMAAWHEFKNPQQCTFCAIPLVTPTFSCINFQISFRMCALNTEIQSAGCCNVRLVGLQTLEVDESHQWWMDTASAVQNGGKFVTKCRQLPDIAQGGNLKRPKKNTKYPLGN